MKKNVSLAHFSGNETWKQIRYKRYEKKNVKSILWSQLTKILFRNDAKSKANATSKKIEELLRNLRDLQPKKADDRV